MASPSLDTLLADPRLWRGAGCARESESGVPTGHAALDQRLPGGGWPRGALAELFPERRGIGELRLLIPALARLSGAGEGVALLAPPFIPYAPALAALGVLLPRLLVVRMSDKRDFPWALEQCLRCGGLAAVIAWGNVPDPRQLRRLQRAAEEGRAFGALFNQTRVSPSPAPLRLALRARGRALEVEVLKRRGAPVAAALLEFDDALDRAPFPRSAPAGLPPVRLPA